MPRDAGRGHEVRPALSGACPPSALAADTAFTSQASGIPAARSLPPAVSSRLLRLARATVRHVFMQSSHIVISALLSLLG